MTAAKAGAWRPTASISSMKMMHGACALPCLKDHAARADADEHPEGRARHREEGPTGFTSNARARSVLPVPGGPTRAHRQASAEFQNFAGLQNSMISRADLASSAPATSSNVTLECLQ